MTRIVVMMFVVAVTCGCGGAVRDWQRHPGKTCAVFSVGGAGGVAHLGAVQALKENKVDIDCVVGTSMGALVGGLYVAAPEEDTAEKFERVLADYIERTKGEAGDGAFAGAFFGALLFGPFGAVAGGLAGAGGVEKKSHERLVRSIREEIGREKIEELGIPFATSYVEIEGEGAKMHNVTEGDLVEAVSGSIANALIFNDLSIKAGTPIDPGIDRLARVPLELACEAFPGARLISINVTDEPGIQTKDMDCPVVEVMIEVPESSAEEILTSKEKRQELIELGYRTTDEFLKELF